MDKKFHWTKDMTRQGYLDNLTLLSGMDSVSIQLQYSYMIIQLLLDIRDELKKSGEEAYRLKAAVIQQRVCLATYVPEDITHGNRNGV